VQKLFHRKYVVDSEKKELGLTPAGVSKTLINPIFMIVGLLVLSMITIGLLYADIKVIGYLTYLLIASPIFIAFIIFSDKSLSVIQKKQVGVIFIVSFFVIFFWSAFEQAGASLTFFADEQTNRKLGISIPAWLIYVLSIGLLYYFYTLLKKITKNLQGDFDKRLRITVYALVVILMVSLAGANLYILSTGKGAFSMKELPASVFQSLNSIFVVSFAPFFAWLWLKLGKREPSSPTKMAFGLFFLALGYLWIAFGVNDIQPSVKVSMIWLTGMYALHTCGELCLSPIGLALVNKLAPFKFASLLMAVWFLANAIANKLAGVLSALYPENGKMTSFLGYHMTNLHEFFMLFVFMAGTASLILFGLTKSLQKMMNPQV